MNNIHTILLDRDGTLIEECHYLHDPEQVRLISGLAAPWRVLAGQGCRFFLVSNQSGIGRGYFDLEAYQGVHARLEELLAAQGMGLDGAAFCPHAPEARCACRKPRTGLWDALAGQHGLQATSTLMIGDKIADIRFGRAIGCRTALVLTGHGADAAAKVGLPPLTGLVQACAPASPASEARADWPDWQALSLGHVLEYLTACPR